MTFTPACYHDANSMVLVMFTVAYQSSTKVTTKSVKLLSIDSLISAYAHNYSMMLMPVTML